MAITKDQVKRWAESLGAEVAQLKAARGFFAVVAAVRRVAPACVQKVEAIAAEVGIKGAEKKALALDLIFALLPPLPWWLPEPILRAVIGHLIEVAVAAFNKSKK